MKKKKNLIKRVSFWTDLPLLTDIFISSPTCAPTPRIISKTPFLSLIPSIIVLITSATFESPNKQKIKLAT